MLVVVAGPVSATNPSAVDRYRAEVRPILVKYCFDCHADDEKKGNVAFDAFKSDEELVGKRELWINVLKNVRAGIMPPGKRRRPTSDEQQVLDRWIKYGAFGLDPQDPDPGRVTVRRLNRVEYRNTIRDLLGVEFDADREFPPDDIGYGFDNIGDVLSFSPLLAEKYMSAADKIVAAAVPLVPKIMPVTELAASSPKEKLSFSTGGKIDYAFKVEKAGDYQIVVEATVRGSFEFDTSRVQIAFKVDGAEKRKEEHGWQSNKKVRWEFPSRFNPGEEHRFELEMTTLPPKKEPVAAKDPTKDPALAKENNPDKPAPPGKKPLGKFGFGKQGNTNLQSISVRLEGPNDQKEWPYQESYLRIFFKGAPPSAPTERRDYARAVLGRFVSRAFRRPANEKTLDRLVAIAESVYTQPDKSFEEGVSQAMIAVLASPRFLFRIEEADPKAPKAAEFAPIDEYSLASRLSYLLWSSMPDEKLFRLAEHGELRAQLKPQVERMLKDPRAAELSRNFAGQWLKARNVDEVPINAPVILRQEGSKARVKLDGDLRTAIRRETELFFDHIARTDRSVLELIDSDYTFLNDALAEFYGIPGVVGKEMRKVMLPKNSPRGGVLTQASVLMVTSNPTRTSPVKRGLFVLDNFLGAPAPPPPADLDIPSLDEAANGAKGEPTMRELLALHRSQALCASCHARMDPLGLGLENFNAMGMFREKENDHPIDASGKLITGETFGNIHELKRILKDSRRRDFYACLTEKFLTYALGRGPEYYDVEAMDRIVQQLERDQGRFSSLLMGIIESAPFQKRRVKTTVAEPARAR